jgi:hypothetical protein
MTSVFDVLASDDSMRRVASRKAVVLAKMRVDKEYGAFIEKHGSQALDHLETEIHATVALACAEVEHADVDGVLATVRDSYKPVETKTASTVHEARKPRMCPFHKDVVDISLAAGDPRAGFDSMGQHWGGPRHCEGDGYEGESCKFKPQMTTQAYWDERAEKAEQKRKDRAERELDAQQEIVNEDEGVTEVENVEPIDETPVAEAPVEDNVVEVDFETTEVEAPAEGTEVPMSMAASSDAAPLDGRQSAEAHSFEVDLRGQGGFTASFTVQAKDEYEARQKAIQQSVAQGNPPAWADQVRVLGHRQADAGPVPKMDKSRWSPQNVKELDVDDDDGPHPTRRKDIVEPIKPENGTRFNPSELSEIGEQVTERQSLPSDSDNAGFSEGGETGEGGTWTKGPNTAVASHDPQKNELVEIMKNDYDGFLPEAEIQTAVLAHRNR